MVKWDRLTGCEIGARARRLNGGLLAAILKGVREKEGEDVIEGRRKKGGDGKVL